MNRYYCRLALLSCVAALSALIKPACSAHAQTTLPGFLTGAGDGGAPHVVSFISQTGSSVNSFFAFEEQFRGGATVGAGDINNDGYEDLIAGAGPGGGPRVQVFDGLKLAQGQQLVLFNQFVFEEAFRGGVYVAGGDTNGDGFDDIIVGAGPGGGPRVQVFSGQNGSVLQNFFAFAEAFRGGVTVGSADINGDGKDDIIVGAGPGGGPQVTVYSGAAAGQVLFNQFVFEDTFRGGVFVAGGNVTGDNRGDIIVGRGSGGDATVRVYSGANSQLDSEFLAFGGGYQGGVLVGGSRFNPQIVVGNSGAGAQAKVLNISGSLSTVASINPYPGFNGAVNVSGFNFVQSANTPTPTATATATPTGGVSTGQISLSLDGIYDNGDGTFTAYIGYNNTFNQDITIAAGLNGSAKNFFSPNPANRGQPSTFLKGSHPGAIVVVFGGELTSYTVGAEGATPSTVSFSGTSVPKLAQVEPLSQCVIQNSDGTFAAVMGYRNTNAFDILIKVGAANKFEPGAANRGQPERFLKGLNNAAFTVVGLNSEVTWKLATKSVLVKPSATECSCPAVGGLEIRSQLNADALALNKVAEKSAALILSVGTKAATTSAQDVKKRTASNLAAIKAATVKIPNVFVTCPASDTPPQCVRVDNLEAIETLNAQFDVAYHIVKRGTARGNFLKTGKTRPADGKTDPLVVEAQKIYDRAKVEIGKYPRYNTSCDR